MAPKRARVSQGTSSSQNPSNPSDRRDYRRHIFQSRPCNPGRPVDLVGLDHLGTLEAFSNINWEPFLSFEGEVPFAAMVEFYAGYDFNESTQRVSLQIFNYSYNWSLEEFSLLLGLTHSGINVFSNSTSFSSLLTQVEESQQTILQSVLAPAHQGNLNPLYLSDQLLPEHLRFWNKIILFNVLGRAGNLDRLGALQCYILYCLRRGILINATYIVAHRMVISESGHQSLPFGYLIRNLFTNLQIPLNGRMLPPAPPLNDLTVSRMGASPGSAHRRHHQDPAPEADDPYAVPAGAISNRQLYSAMMNFQRQVNERLEDIDEQLWTLTNQMDEIEFVDSD